MMNMNAQNYLQNDVQNDVQFNVQRFNNYVDDLLNISAVNYGCTPNKVKRHVEYVNRLLRYHANNYKVLAIIDTLFQRVDEKYEYLKNKRIQIRDRLLVVFREGFNNTFDMYNEYDDNEQEPCGRFKLDIHVNYPLERQTNEFFEEFDDPLILSLQSKLFCIIDLSRTIYTYCVRYLNKLTTQINYVKGQIFKYELARRDNLFDNKNKCQISLALDVMLNTEFIKFYQLQDTIAQWNSELNNVSVDYNFMSQTSLLDIETNGNAILYEYYNKYFDRQYNLPTSVIKECVTNNDTQLWSKVCNIKNIMFNKTLGMPKSYVAK